MLLNRWNSLATLVLASAGAAGFAAAEEPAAEAEQPIVIRARVAAEDGENVPLELVAKSADEASPYWIGVQLEPPTDILKEHLKLEGGMVVVHVFEGSPAEKVGLKANDIILKSADGYIKEPGDLLKSVGKAQEGELTLVLLRGGKEQTVKIVPVKRPEAPAQRLVQAAPSEEQEAVRNLELALNLYKRQALRADGETRAVDVLRVRPGVVRSYTATPLGLPKDVAVIITKEGVAPAKIVVKKDGKEFEATEETLEKLPEDVRGYVQSVRGGNPFAYRALGEPLAAPATATKTAKVYRATVAAVPAPASATEPTKVYRYHVDAKHAAADVDSKLDRILKIVSQQEDSSVAELRKEVQQLRKELAELRQEKK